MFDDATVDTRIKWKEPFKGIFHDLDGTLTKQGPDSYVSAYWSHNDWPECNVDMELYDGIICPSPYAIERIVFFGAKGDVGYNPLLVWQYEDANIAGKTEEELADYLTEDNGSEVVWKRKGRPSKHWTAPYVTDHRYYMRWAWGLDFEQILMGIEPYIWEPSDKNIEVVMPFYE
jgi:hypothetical protein